MKTVQIEALKTEGMGDERKVATHLLDFEAPDTPHEDAPAARPYRFNFGQLRDLQVAISLGLNVLLTGPTGCGKTSLPIALAALLGRPLIRFNCNGETRVSSLVGMQKPTAVNGVLSLKFSPGDLVQAMRENYWVVFDEIDAAMASVLMVLQPVLEENSSVLHIPETGERVEAGSGFRIFATGNTLGNRASTRAHHAGTNVMNTAFLDRFGMVIAADYPDRFEEIERVKVNCPGVDEDLIDGACRVAEHLRADKSFRSDFSTRRLVQWARLMPHYTDDKGCEDVLATFELTIARKLTSMSDLKVSRETVRRIFGYDEQ